MKLFVVLGLGQFGHHTARTLHEGGADVLAIDQDAKRVDKVKGVVSQAVCMDATDAEGLRAVGASKARTAVVALGEADLEASILCCAALSDLGIARIIVRAANPLQARILKRVGATEVVFPEKEMGEHIAHSILLSGVIDQVTLSTGQVVAQILPRQDIVGKTLKEAELRPRYGVNVIGVQHPEQTIDDDGEAREELILENAPDPDRVIAEDDILVVVGSQDQISFLARED